MSLHPDDIVESVLKKGDEISKEEYLSTYTGEDRIVSSDVFLEELKNRGENPVKMFSKIPKLDSLIGHFEGGELYAISGQTKNGKTTFAQTLTKNFEEQGVHSLWFSFEVSGPLLFSKFVKTKLFYLPKKLYDKRLDWLEDRILEAKLKYKVKAVFIDHLHYLVDIERTRDSSLDIGSVIRKLKIIAIENNIVVFLLCHTKKLSSVDMPSAEDVRDSSFIPQEADSTMMVWRVMKKNKRTKEIEDSGKTLLIVSNHRRAGVMNKVVSLRFKDGLLFEEANMTLDEAATEEAVNSSTEIIL